MALSLLPQVAPSVLSTVSAPLETKERTPSNVIVSCKFFNTKPFVSQRLQLRLCSGCDCRRGRKEEIACTCVCCVCVKLFCAGQVCDPLFFPHLIVQWKKFVSFCLFMWLYLFLSHSCVGFLVIAVCTCLQIRLRSSPAKWYDKWE